MHIYPRRERKKKKKKKVHPISGLKTKLFHRLRLVLFSNQAKKVQISSSCNPLVVVMEKFFLLSNRVHSIKTHEI